MGVEVKAVKNNSNEGLCRYQFVVGCGCGCGCGEAPYLIWLMMSFGFGLD